MTDVPNVQPYAVPPPLPTPKRSSWPTVLGIIVIVLASLALLSLPCIVLQRSMQGFLPNLPSIRMFPDWYWRFQLIAGLVWFSRRSIRAEMATWGQPIPTPRVVARASRP